MPGKLGKLMGGGLKNLMRGLEDTSGLGRRDKQEPPWSFMDDNNSHREYSN